MNPDQLAVLALFWMFFVPRGNGRRYLLWVSVWLAGIHLGLLSNEEAFVILGWCSAYYLHAALAIRLGWVRPVVVSSDRGAGK